MLSQSVQEIIKTPTYYQDEYNSTATQNFYCILEKLFNILKPKHFCEIGVERGFSSEQFRKLTLKNNISHTIVDPNLSHARQRNLPAVNFFEEKSINFLSRKISNFPDFFLIDGDHNYITVIEELELINSNVKNNQNEICILLHDVGWPWGRRDNYYDPEGLKIDEARFVKNTGLRLENEDTVDRSFPSGDVYGMAISYGGNQNGVLTAIEDFITSNQEMAWKYFSIPSFYGLGFLWSEKLLPNDKRTKLNQYIETLKDLQDLFACAESNRLRLIQGLHEHMHDLEIAKKIIHNLELEKSILQNRIFDKKVLIQKIKKIFR